MPASRKAAGGYDSLNHMMEEYFSLPVGDMLADDLLEAIADSIACLPTSLKVLGCDEVRAILAESVWIQKG